MSLVALLVGSCAKDEAVVDARPDAQEPAIAARIAFENQHSAGSAEAGSPQKKGYLLWEEAFTTHGGKTTYVFVPIRTGETYYAGETEGKQHPVTARLRASATDGKWAFDLVLYIPEGNGWEASGRFTGTAIAEAWFGGRSRMAHFYDGRLMANGRGPDGRITKLMGTTCYTTTVSAYVNGMLNTTYTSTTCIGSGGPGQDDGWGPLPEPDPRIGNEDDGSGDDTPENRNLTLDITDKLNDYPCAQALVAQLTTLDNGLAKLLDEIFGNSENFNVNFESSDLLADDEDGTETGQGLSLDNWDNPTYTSTIKLNTFILENATKEYILITMYHEALHSFLRAERNRLGSTAFSTKYPGFTEYEYTYGNGKRTKKYKIAQTHARFAIYVDALTDAIQSFNPDMPLASARAMAKMGIVEDSSLSNTEKILNGNERDVSTGNAKGTKCP
ncbi:hypothetical protein [Parapedobacter sp. 10938]|uniref:hypothetical protein n=1 Tax=Parapedobacter flavus TaxID=3110225 RepID=UPI002DBA936E|nr:hypothetical protein [Parapedobacter sp. 10938]MEC3878773.1 hypothetical protein [Parapedobacter sp. 10938]